MNRRGFLTFLASLASASAVLGAEHAGAQTSASDRPSTIPEEARVADKIDAAPAEFARYRRVYRRTFRRRAYRRRVTSRRVYRRRVYTRRVYRRTAVRRRVYRVRWF
jgi:hypothetical protein